MKIVIVIPIYREPSCEELISLNSCCRVLSKYKICFVAPNGLQLTSYESIMKSYGLSFQVEFFNKSFFEGISGYNSLLLSVEFYLRFIQYDYMLICQPDAYVFEDKLEYWCEQGYDYIGAPLIGKYTDNKFYREMPMRVGNGGFSLRKISKYLDFFNGKKNVFTSKQIIKNINLWKKPHTRFFVWFLMLCGWRNKPNNVAQHWRHNEDDFWSGYLDNSNYSLSKPEPIEALNFAFERFPSEMYNLNRNKLPFGCHAWEKYEFESFWKQYIK